MTNELTADGLRELVAGATQQGWTADAFSNLCIGMKPLFKKTGGSAQDAALIVALVNAAPQIIAMMEEYDEARRVILIQARREIRMKKALETVAEHETDRACMTSTEALEHTLCEIRDIARAALQPKETDDAE